MFKCCQSCVRAEGNHTHTHTQWERGRVVGVAATPAEVQLCGHCGGRGL